MSIAKYIPEPLKPIIKEATKSIRLRRLYGFDRQVFQKNFQDSITKTSQGQIFSHLIFFSYQIEKSISREDFEPGHSGEVLKKIARTLDIYESQKYNKKSFAYEYALSAIEQLTSLYKKDNGDISFLKTNLGKWFDIAQESEMVLSGYKTIGKRSKLKNRRVAFKELFQGRYSVREFADTKVSVKTIQDAIDLSMKTPSVCNRQDARVYVLTDAKKIADVLKIQGGFGGYKTPPVLLLVAADNRCFVSVNERRQGFIDGGLFSMSLLLSLEYFRLAACPLHAMLGIRQEKSIRRIIGVKPHESLVMFAAVGNFKEKTKVCASSRLRGGDITTII